MQNQIFKQKFQTRNEKNIRNHLASTLKVFSVSTH